MMSSAGNVAGVPLARVHYLSSMPGPPAPVIVMDNIQNGCHGDVLRGVSVEQVGGVRARTHTRAQIKSYIRAIVPLHVHCLQVGATDCFSKCKLTDETLTVVWRVGLLACACVANGRLVCCKPSRWHITPATGPV
jgi:hypothetical protein